MSASLDGSDLLRALLREIYYVEGPRNNRGKIVPPKRFASYSPDYVDQHWDFPRRHLMQRIAKAIS